MDQSGLISLDAGHLKKLSIPSTSMVGHHVVYHIEVFLSDYSWIVKRRYREFCELHEQLIKEFKLEQTLFPPKKYIGNLNPDHIEKRRAGLETYLKHIVGYLKRIPKQLQTFLEFHIFDILAVTQTLAEKLFEDGDSMLTNEEPFILTPLQLYCISKRLKLPIPTCAGDGYCCDVGNLYDIVYCVKNLKIIRDDSHELTGLSEENMSLDLSLFKNLESLEILNCDTESLQGTYHLQEHVKKLAVHASLHLVKDILIDQEVWTPGSGSNHFPLTDSPSMVWKNLTEADLSHNSVPYIDQSITLLHNLEKLNLSHNEIKEIEHLQDLPNLGELDLSHNQIETLDGINTKLGNIKILRLVSNKVKTVGSGIPKVYSLVELDLSENLIDDIADVMSLANLPCLEVLNLLENPVSKKDMYRSRLLTAFEERVSQICLDKIDTTAAEIQNVRRLLADIDTYELITSPLSTPRTPVKSRTGHKKLGSRQIQIKEQDDLETSVAEVASVPSKATHFASGEQEFKDRVEQIRHLGGDAWLSLLNELQNEYKNPADPRIASMPERRRPHDQSASTVEALCSAASEIDVSDRFSSERSSARQVAQPTARHSSLQFGFSSVLEELVNEEMKAAKHAVTGTFIVTAEVTSEENQNQAYEEERMVGIDLTKGVLMEIAIDTGKTCAKHKLDEVSSVDILETPDAFYVDILHTKHKELRHHRDFLPDSGLPSSEGDYRRIAKYKMRSVKNAAELFALLYKFVSDSSTTRYPEQRCKSLSQISQSHPALDSAASFCNPVGMPTDVFHQYLTTKFQETELTESGLHSNQTGQEVIRVVLWTSCLPYALPQHEIPVCLVLTNLNIYVLHLKNDQIQYPMTSPSKLDDVEARLPLLSCLPVAQLRVVVCGLFELGFRLEFSKRGPRGTFTFLTRNSTETETFLRALEKVTQVGILPSYLAPSGDLTDMRSLDVLHSNEAKLERLKQEIALSLGKAFREDECILMYTVVREVSDMTSDVDKHERLTSHTRTLVVTNWRLFLCEEDHVHWPTPSYVKDPPSTPQWLVVKHGDVKRIIGIELFDVIGDPAFVGTSGMSLLLEHKTHAPKERDSSHQVELWNLIFKVEEEREQLQRSLSQIWSYNFHGKLQITKSRILRAQKILHSSPTEVPVQFFQEVFSPVSSPAGSPSTSRPGKGHRRNASGQNYLSQLDDTVRISLQTLHKASAESLEKFFMEKLRPTSARHDEEAVMSYALTDCVAYSCPTREIHVWLILSNFRVYLVTDSADRSIIGPAEDASFGPGTNLCFRWIPLTSLRQVCVGLFDQTFRLETDNPESTFTFITRDYQVTSHFLKNLNQALQEIAPEEPPTISGEESPSIYDTNPNDCKADEERHFHHSDGVVRFVYPSDDTVEILKHSIVEFSKNSESCDELLDVSILMYLLVFQVIGGKKLPRTFMILDEAVCTCLENHVNFPLPLFVKGLPMGSRYEIERLRLFVEIEKIEVSGFNTQDFTIVFQNRTRREKNCTQPTENAGDIASSNVMDPNDRGCSDNARWSLIAQTYDEKEKALAMILRFWKEKCGQDLPVLRV